MRLVLVSLSTPTYNNVRAASALPYHLISALKSNLGAEVEIYSYNINGLSAEDIKKVELELGCIIHLLEKPRWIKWLMALHLMFLRIFLRYPLYSYCKLSKDCVNEIKKSNPSRVWIYGEELAGLTKSFSNLKCIVTMPDCESLYYYRMLRQPWATKKLFEVLKYSFAYWQYKSLEIKNSYKDVLYHFVGKADSDFFKSMNKQVSTLFLRHPLYAFNKEKEITFHQPLIKLIFTGRYDIYCKHGSDDFLSALAESNLSSYYEITFLGKGWEEWNKKLNSTGYISNHILFAPDYIVELQKHDIQVNAIDVGTGTKGKVLDGIANGLLVIGTQAALENISVCDRESCVIVSTGEEFVRSLEGIRKNIYYFECIAEKGQNEVITKHCTLNISKQLFQLN